MSKSLRICVESSNVDCRTGARPYTYYYKYIKYRLVAISWQKKYDGDCVRVYGCCFSLLLLLFVVTNQLFRFVLASRNECTPLNVLISLYEISLIYRRWCQLHSNWR